MGSGDSPEASVIDGRVVECDPKSDGAQRLREQVGIISMRLDLITYSGALEDVHGLNEGGFLVAEGFENLGYFGLIADFFVEGIKIMHGMSNLINLFCDFSLLTFKFIKFTSFSLIENIDYISCLQEFDSSLNLS